MVDDGVVVIFITLGLPKHQNINQKIIGDLYKVWASLFWDSNAFGNMIWIRSTWW